MGAKKKIVVVIVVIIKHRITEYVTNLTTHPFALTSKREKPSLIPRHPMELSNARASQWP